MAGTMSVCRLRRRHHMSRIRSSASRLEVGYNSPPFGAPGSERRGSRSPAAHSSRGNGPGIRSEKWTSPSEGLPACRHDGRIVGLCPPNTGPGADRRSRRVRCPVEGLDTARWPRPHRASWSSRPRAWMLPPPIPAWKRERSPPNDESDGDREKSDWSVAPDRSEGKAPWFLERPILRSGPTSIPASRGLTELTCGHCSMIIVLQSTFWCDA